MVKLCAFPSTKMGTNGVTSRKYVGRSRAPYEVIGLMIQQEEYQRHNHSFRNRKMSTNQDRLTSSMGV